MSQTTLLDGRTVDYVVRRERGTINRFIYSFAMLAERGEDPGADPDTSLWNKRLIYTFDGGVAIGRNQGTPGGSALYDIGLSKGYAIVHSSGTRTSTHYNLELGGETALMTKEEFVERYGVPLYTVGVGGSGGGIQQYVYGQNHPQLLDAGIPQYSYPDMVTQTIHVGDCELLEQYMDVTDPANPKWQNWDNREWLEGLNAHPTRPNPYRGGAPGNSECVNGWRGLTPLAMNPLFHPSVVGAGADRMNQALLASTHWTHWEDVKNIYGVGPDGYARQTWDNVGVQYGLGALTDGKITPQEFLDINAKVGSWKDPGQMVQEGQPFLPVGGFDPWSRRNMRLSSDGGVTPAPRREGDLSAMHAAYTRGLYFDGDVDMPMIDWRHYLEEELDMHNSHQSFASRQRMLDQDGDASNQVIWFTDARPARQVDQTPEAFGVIDEWMANIREHPDQGVAGNKPELATDRCFTTQGVEIARGATTCGTASSTTIPMAPARRRSRSTRPHGSSRVDRFEVASTSAPCSRSRTRSPRACTAIGSPRPRRSRAWRRSSRRACATTRCRTWVVPRAAAPPPGDSTRPAFRPGSGGSGLRRSPGPPARPSGSRAAGRRRGRCSRCTSRSPRWRSRRPARPPSRSAPSASRAGRARRLR